MSTITKTAGGQYRLYSEDGKVIGDFKNMRDAKRRQLDRAIFLKATQGKKK